MRWFFLFLGVLFLGVLYAHTSVQDARWLDCFHAGTAHRTYATPTQIDSIAAQCTRRYPNV
jgi:hypothetical protein